MKLRDDLALAAYAVSLGFELLGHLNVELSLTPFNDDGIPPDSIQFVLGDVHVWDTARGWRVARLINDVYETPTDSSFFQKLKQALDEGSQNWRDR